MIVIVGASASGKTTLARDFVNAHPEYRRVVTYTTRPIRGNETDGVDYHFIDEKRFKELASNGFFAESNAYREWLYGTAVEDCADDDHIVAVLTPAGMRELKRRGIKVFAVYLYVDRASRMIGAIQRGDNVDEAYRRNVSDVGQFDAVEDEADAVIDNSAFHMSQADVLRVFDSIIELYKAGEFPG